jgi:hypothetical protein
LRTDAAISGKPDEPDLLRRTPFANRIASEFLLQLRQTSLVISVEGPWGYGKTSTLNLIKGKLNSNDSSSKPIIFDFNPWMAGSAEAMVESFLLQLASLIGLSDRSKEARDASKQLIGYSGIFNALKFVPGAEPWASLLGGVLEKVGKATESISDLKKLNLEKRKQDAAKALLTLNRPVIAFIDDLDRLTPTETFEMVRVIKAVADFPRMTYVLAFDVDHMQSALKHSGIDRATEYLEKLIQVRLNLPVISQGQMEKILNVELAKLPTGLSAPFEQRDPQRLGWIYHQGLARLIETPRDINRIFNRLALSVPTLGGEVSFADLFALDVLAVKCPSVYERIRAQPDLFLRKKSATQSPFDTKAPKPDPFESVVDGVNERHKPHVIKVLHELFPALSEGTGADERRTLRSQGRIAVKDRLLAALSFDSSPGDVPIPKVLEFISERSTRDRFIDDVITHENIDAFFDFIDTFQDLDPDDPEHFAESIGRLCASKAAHRHDGQAREQFTFLRTATRAWITLRPHIDRVSPAVRIRILRKLCLDGPDLNLAAEIVAECYRQGTPQGSTAGSDQRRTWLSASQRDAIIKNWAARNLRLLVETKIPATEVRTIFRTARYVCPEKLPRILSARLKRDDGLDRFALIAAHTGVQSPGGPYVEMSDEQLKDVGNVKWIRQRAQSRLRRLPKGADTELRASLTSMANGKKYFTTTGKEAR